MEGDAGTDRLIAHRYRLLETVGSGATGTVWRARDEVLGRDVAVKEVVLPAGLPESEREHLRERTRREARAAARISSPSAVTVYDVVEQDGHPFLVMEFVRARSLSEVIRADGPLSPQRTAQVGLAVLTALDAAHAVGVLHRDVKPGNVLVRDDGRVVLTDFGIATFRGDASITSTGLLLGSPAYIAPERARGHSPGAASDLWSLGATLYTAVEGRPAFDTGEPLTTMTAVVAGDARPCVAAGPLQPALHGLMDKDPARRWTSAAARAGLTAVLHGPATPTTPATPAPAVPAPAAPAPAAPVHRAVPLREHATQEMPLPTPVPARSRRGAVIAFAAVVVALAACVGYVAVTAGPSASPRTAGSGRASPSAPARGAAPVRARPPAVPPTWATYTDPSGWSVRYPPSWEVGSYKRVPQLRDPRTRRTVRLSPAAVGRDPLAGLTTTAVAFGRTHRGYSQLALQQVGPDAIWEFRYTDGIELHVRDSALERGFTVFAQAHADDWAAADPVFRLIVSSLRTG